MYLIRYIITDVKQFASSLPKGFPAAVASSLEITRAFSFTLILLSVRAEIRIVYAYRVMISHVLLYLLQHILTRSASSSQLCYLCPLNRQRMKISAALVALKFNQCFNKHSTIKDLKLKITGIPLLLFIDLSSTTARIFFCLFFFLANLAWNAAVFSNSLLALSSAVSFLGSLDIFFFFFSTRFEGSLFFFCFFSLPFGCFSTNDSLSKKREYKSSEV